MQVEIERMRLRIYGFNLLGSRRTLCPGRSRQHCKKTYFGSSHSAPDDIYTTLWLQTWDSIAARFASNRDGASFRQAWAQSPVQQISHLTMSFQERRSNLTGPRILLAPFPEGCTIFLSSTGLRYFVRRARC